ncbi:MAG: hypothetical protein ACYTEQ_13705 [Planctomycetota bacterium]|jgi:hypothetical protein
MASGKTEKKKREDKTADAKAGKKKRIRKLVWLAVDLAIAAVILGLFLYKPGRYNPLEAVNSKKVAPYLTHELMPQLYNGAQRGQPFDLVITQEGINEIIAYSKWPKESGGATFSAPAVLFVPDSIVLMGTVELQGVEFVVTIELEAGFDEAGLMKLRASKVKVGAMNITLLARIIAKKMYAQRVAAIPIDKEDFRAKIAASLLNDEAFEAVLNVKEVFGSNDVKVRIEKVSIEPEKLTLGLVPLPD